MVDGSKSRFRKHRHGTVGKRVAQSAMAFSRIPIHSGGTSSSPADSSEVRISGNLDVNDEISAMVALLVR